LRLNQKDFKVLKCLRFYIFDRIKEVENKIIYTNSDGGARGNPGPGAIGIIVRKDGKILTKYSSKIGEFVTNNTAEYEALIKALELALKISDQIYRMERDALKAKYIELSKSLSSI